MANIKDMIKTVMGDPMAALSEAGPMISQMYKPELLKFIDHLQKNNLESGENHLALHIVVKADELKILAVTMDEDGNLKRVLQELPFELIFGLGLLKKTINETTKS